MDALNFVLLLFSALGLQDAEEIQEKTVGKEPDETPICTNGTHGIIVLVVCKIRTQSSRECLLRYQGGRDFDHQCDSKFSLMTKNQTVFLLLTSLTPADGGNYTCECASSNGTFILHLNISVRADQSEGASAGDAAPHNWTIVVVAIMVTVIILGCICRRLKRLRSETSAASGHRSPDISGEPDPDDPYQHLQEPTADVYQTVTTSESIHLDPVGTSSSSVDYENI